MSKDDVDQDAMAAEWAASLGGDDKEPGQSEEDMAAAWEAALKKQTAGDEGGEPGDDDLAGLAAALADKEQKAVSEEKKRGLAHQARDAELKDMTEAHKAPRPDGLRRELDFILDIPLDVSAELGRTRLLINELLQLGQGSVVELNKLAGEPLEVFVNGKLVARGEAVVINEKFGVRLTDIISPIERVKQLG
jgi:flagellar motor switch protein FliN/FliY